MHKTKRLSLMLTPMGKTVIEQLADAGDSPSRASELEQTASRVICVLRVHRG